MRRICVFCGSKPGVNPLYRHAAEQLGLLLAPRGLDLVYGGGTIGLMGVLANAALAGGAEVIGVIPEVLAAEELAHPNLTTLHVVSSMHARKAKMAELSDAFIALPGGFGTLEELFEVITWSQLGIHRKPVGVLNVAGYFDGLVRLVEHAITEGFISAKHRQLWVVQDDASELLHKLERHELPPVRPRVLPEQI